SSSSPATVVYAGAGSPGSPGRPAAGRPRAASAARSPALRVATPATSNRSGSAYSTRSTVRARKPDPTIPTRALRSCASTVADATRSHGGGGGLSCPGGLAAADPPPRDEADQREHAVDDVHERRGPVPRGEQERHAHQVDGHPDEPELDPALGHAVGREHRSDEDPGVRPHRLVRAERAEERGEQERARDHAGHQSDPGAP